MKKVESSDERSFELLPVIKISVSLYEGKKSENLGVFPCVEGKIDNLCWKKHCLFGPLFIEQTFLPNLFLNLSRRTSRYKVLSKYGFWKA